MNILTGNNGRMTGALSKATRWTRGSLVPTLRRRPVFGAAFVISVALTFYWCVLASDRYLSEAHVIIQSTAIGVPQTPDLSAMLGTMSTGTLSDQLLLRDHLLSVDMLLALDAKLDLRSHYSDWRRDPVSRMWFKSAPVEDFHEHFLSRVSVELDSYTGILIVQAQGYDPETAHAIAVLMVERGEQYMNEVAHRLAENQVAFLEKQVAQLGERARQTRGALLAYQNAKGMVSPQSATDNAVGISNRLEGTLADLQTRRGAMLTYLMPTSPAIVDIDSQIAAVKREIASQNARLASPNGSVLNATVAEYQRLELAAQMSEEEYKASMAALEQGRVEATRTLKKVSVLQSPTRPEYPLEPTRIYNSLVSVLVTFLLAGVVHLLAAIIRDHRD
jgi:capsular polysaccharide transport system permease protein